MIEIITLSIITGLSGFAFGYLIKAHYESGWKQMYLYEQKKRVAAEESKDVANDYAILLENRLIAQQKDLESLLASLEMRNTVLIADGEWLGQCTACDNGLTEADLIGGDA